MTLKQRLKKLLKENSRRDASFTLIELVIVIGILAILAVVIILVLNPSEFLRQARDSTRMSDLQTLHSALGQYQADGGTNLGLTNKVYVSIPDSSTSCANLGLPTLPDGWSYKCSNSANYRKTDSLGWIPVAFSNISYGNVLNILPIDPVNSTSTGEYYTYVAGGSWELTTLFESDKYSNTSTNDGDAYPGVYSLRSSTSPLTPGIRDKGMVGYWKFDETNGTLYDSSGYGNNGTQSGGVTYGATGKVGNALSFDGSDDYVSLGTGLSVNSLTVSFFLKFNSIGNRLLITKGNWNTNAASYTINYRTDHIRIDTFSSDTEYGLSTFTWMPTLGIWYHVTVIADSTNLIHHLFIDGVEKTLTVYRPYEAPRSASYEVRLGANTDGQYPFNGLIDDVRIYNRALSAAEIAAIYNATR